MSKLKLYFEKAGLQTTVQDQGRYGHQHLGIPINGAMDQNSALLANELVRNQTSSPVFEITLIGPRVIFKGDGVIAITGADLSPLINEQPSRMNSPMKISDGDTLTFGKPKLGCRAYLAVRGNWEVSEWLGSASASAVDGETLTPGNIVSDGSVFSFENDNLKIRTSKNADMRKSTKIQSPLKVRVMPGPEYSTFDQETLTYFFGYWFPISQEANRMGYRLDKNLKDFKMKQEVISSGIVKGTIQITNDGTPIILMADAQTSGGYPRIANIISPDLDRVAQLKPGDLIGFELVEPSIDLR